MSQNYYIQEQLHREHCQELQHEIEQKHLVAEASRNHTHRSAGRHAISVVGARLVALGRWMEQIEQRETQIVNQS